MLAVVIHYILTILKLVIFVDVVLSWLQAPDQMPRRLTRQITDPLYAPIRTVIDPQKLGGIDISPLLLLALISLMQNLLRGAHY